MVTNAENADTGAPDDGTRPVETDTGGTGGNNPPPPSLIRSWMRLLLGFTVSVAIGLAPYLGRVKVPLFDSLLTLIPDSIQNTVLPLSAALMGIIAVVIQWYGGAHLSRRWLEKYFKLTLLLVVLSFIALFVVHTFVVVKVEYLGGKGSKTFLVGFVRPDGDPCTPKMSDPECIKHLTLDDAAVESYWGSGQVRVARLALIAPYLIFTGMFGMLVGLLLLRDQMLRAQS
jgi:hypothetical protein